MSFITGRESLQLPLLNDAFRSAVQSAPAPQMTSTIEDAIVNHEPDRPFSSLQARAASLSVAAPRVQQSLNSEVILRIQYIGGLNFLQNEPTHQNDPTIVLAAVTQNGLAVRYASERLKDDHAIVLAAVTEYGLALQHASERLKDDRPIVLAAVTQNGRALQYASESLKDDPAIVLADVTQNGDALQYASERLKDDHDLVLAAVTQNGLVLQYFSKRLQDDPAIVLVAVTQYGRALKSASERLQDDHAIVLAAVTQNGHTLKSASERLKDDPAIVLAAVTQNGHALKSASERLKDDNAIVLAAVTQNGHALKSASKRLKDDPTFLLAAVTQNGLALENISVDLKTIEIACAAVAQNREAMPFVPIDLIKNANGEINTNPAFLPFLNPSHIEYQHGLQAVKLNPLLLGFVPPEILEERPVDGTEDDDIILLALKQNPEALHLIPWDLLTAEMLSFVIKRHKTNNKAELIRSLVKFVREMGRKTSAEIRSPHLDLAWPLLEFFENSKQFMLILINKYGLGITDVGSEIKNDPEILAADAQTLQQSLSIAPKRVMTYKPA